MNLFPLKLIISFVPLFCPGSWGQNESPSPSSLPNFVIFAPFSTFSISYDFLLIESETGGVDAPTDPETFLIFSPIPFRPSPASGSKICGPLVIPPKAPFSFEFPSVVCCYLTSGGYNIITILSVDCLNSGVSFFAAALFSPTSPLFPLVFLLSRSRRQMPHRCFLFS